MTDQLHLLLEIGPKGKKLAGAMDWPGLERRGKTMTKPWRAAAYVPRYAPVAERSASVRSSSEAAARAVGAHAGQPSIDWWRIAHVPSVIEADPLPDDELELRIGTGGTWALFDGQRPRPARRSPKARGAARERDLIVRHVYASERHNFWRKVAIREPDEVRLTPTGLADFRERFVAAIREYHAEDRPPRKWPLRFLIRRTAQHAMDHRPLGDRGPRAEAERVNQASSWAGEVLVLHLPRMVQRMEGRVADQERQRRVEHPRLPSPSLYSRIASR